jgi:hypothetical protein
MAIRRATVLGIANWAIILALAVALSGLRESSRSLFESLVAVAVAGSTTSMGLAYFQRRDLPSRREGIALGILWMVIAVVIDLPLMLPAPMSLSLGEYLADVGATYLMMPLVTCGLAAAQGRGHA